MSLSPMAFTKLLKPVLKWTRRRGILISAYLDDLIIVGKTELQTASSTQTVFHKLQSLGFLVNMTKSHLTPTTSINHLGLLSTLPQ